MKKALFCLVFLGIAIPTSALTACAPGDKFNIFTGERCPEVVNTADAKDAIIATLRAQIASLQAQILSLGTNTITIGSVNTKGSTLSKVDSLIASTTVEFEGVSKLLRDYSIYSNPIYKNGIVYTGSQMQEDYDSLKEKLRRLSILREEVFFDKTLTFPLSTFGL